MSSDSSSNPSPPPDSSSTPAADVSQSPPPPTPDASSPPPPSSDNASPSDSGNKSSNPPPSGKDNDESPSSDDDRNSPSPPRSRLSPPSRSGNDFHRSKSPQLEDTSGKYDDSLNQTAIIAGAAAGAALLLAILILSIVCCCCRKKKKTKPNQEIQYYRDNNSPHQNANNYYQNPASGEYMVKIPAPPAPGSGVMSSEYGWTPAPPPPPPYMNSSEIRSAGFSGGAYQGGGTPAMGLGFSQSSFTYEDLAAATGGFAQVNLLGQGGFGFVHKGVLPNGKEIAVKSLKSNSGQGDREFQAEVDIISRVHHRHLVSLVGYCTTGAQRLLVYEFVNNGTLEDHLHGAGKPTMDWATIHQIALGSAKGFAYLHEDCHPRIIHRDIKAANILIDSNFEAKVADFGLAKLSNDNHTHVSTRIMGTFGYLAPEYASSGKLTEKSDVYSFGIMLLELITGRRPIDITSDDDSLVDWARPILMKVQEGGSYEKLVDPRLGDNYDRDEMLHMVASAGACIRHSARARPKMSQIVRALEGDVSLDDLNKGAKITSTQMSSRGSDYDLRKFAKGTLSSQEYSSSEEVSSEFQSRS